MKQLIAAMLVFIILASSAASLDAEFLGPKQFELCPCQSHTIQVSLDRAVGPVKLTPNHPVELSSYIFTGEGNVREIALSVSCEAQPAGYEFVVTASDNEDSKELLGVIEVNDCDSLGLQLVGTAKTCDYAEYTLQASNNALVTRSISVETNLNTAYHSISRSQFTLTPNGKANFTLTIRPPARASEQSPVIVTVTDGEHATSIEVPFALPLCTPSSGVTTSDQGVSVFVQPQSTTTTAQPVPSFELPYAANITGPFAGSRFGLPFAIIFILALLAFAFLYFRYKYDESAEDERRERERVERTHHLMQQIERRH